MKFLIAIAVAVVVTTFGFAARTDSVAALGLPTLHVIKTIELSPTYSCRSPEDFNKGYASTALFLSTHAKRMNSPELLFNGACRGDDFFDVSMAGDDMSLIADLGADVLLEELSATHAFNVRRVHADAAYSKFVRSAAVKLNHTYAVVTNERDCRALFLFTVTQHVPNKSVTLRYAVKAYQVQHAGFAVASGFDWEKKSGN